MAMYDSSTTLLNSLRAQNRTAEQTPGLVTLHLALSLAMVLPPAAIVPPVHSGRPLVRSDAHVIVDAREVQAVITRPMSAVGSGRVGLGEIDRRLHGLMVRVDAFRVNDESGAVLSIGLVSPASEHGVGRQATARDLWLLATEAFVNHAVPAEPIVGMGDVACLAHHGGGTVQVAWLTDDRLASVSVTCLGDEPKTWMIDTAISVAEVVDDRLLRGQADDHCSHPGRDELMVRMLTASERTIEARWSPQKAARAQRDTARHQPSRGRSC